MVTPKITKCGHIYCWPCVLQYLAYERERNWKRCPLCNEPVYKHSLRNVKIVQTHYFKEGAYAKFNLMIRNKSNIIVKDKEITGSEVSKKTKLPLSKFPSESMNEYHASRLLLSNSQNELEDFMKD
jgi:Zinc finger, C3HC4 type (RING finger)